MENNYHTLLDSIEQEYGPVKLLALYGSNNSQKWDLLLAGEWQAVPTAVAISKKMKQILPPAELRIIDSLIILATIDPRVLALSGTLLIPKGDVNIENLTVNGIRIERARIFCSK